MAFNKYFLRVVAINKITFSVFLQSFVNEKKTSEDLNIAPGIYCYESCMWYMFGCSARYKNIDFDI